MATIKEVVEQLPPELQEQVKDYAIFLLEKKIKKKKNKPNFNWAGALSQLKKQYTSVDLQHTISTWRVKNNEDSSRY